MPCVETSNSFKFELFWLYGCDENFLGTHVKIDSRIERAGLLDIIDIKTCTKFQCNSCTHRGKKNLENCKITSNG
jgi:hypothetical protein